MSTYTPEQVQWALEHLRILYDDEGEAAEHKHLHEKPKTLPTNFPPDIIATTLAEQRAEIARQTARANINERYAQYLEFTLGTMHASSSVETIINLSAERDRTIKALDALGE